MKFFYDTEFLEDGTTIEQITATKRPLGGWSIDALISCSGPRYSTHLGVIVWDKSAKEWRAKVPRVEDHERLTHVGAAKSRQGAIKLLVTRYRGRGLQWLEVPEQ